MPIYIMVVTDEVTTRRTKRLVIDAPDTDQAEQAARDRAREGITDWDDVTPILAPDQVALDERPAAQRYAQIVGDIAKARRDAEGAGVTDWLPTSSQMDGLAALEAEIGFAPGFPIPVIETVDDDLDN